MSLVQRLPEGPLDIIGDIHGEIAALEQLLAHLGYDARGHHPEGRHLVFVGDFCDRGPDSPAVLRLVLPMLAGGQALSVLGNHEINLLRGDAKDGSGWYFDSRVASDLPKYGAVARLSKGDAQAVLERLNQMPLALERADLRVVHAAWCEPQIGAARGLQAGDVRHLYDRYEDLAQERADAARVLERMRAECEQWPHSLEDPDHRPPFLPAHSERELGKAMVNPLKVLTTGVERECRSPFYAGGKWRFVQRVAWWNEYAEAPAVVVGHYWRRTLAGDAAAHGPQAENLFGHTGPLAWLGARGNVFCVDYSVGARWAARRNGEDPGRRFKLAALRWPERRLMFDDGVQRATQGFGQPAGVHAPP